MTQATYENICILINHARDTANDDRTKEAARQVGKYLRTLPEYKTAMRRAAKEMEAFLA